MADRSMSHETQVGIGATSGSAATKQLTFASCGLGKQEDLLDAGGITGSRGRPGSRVALGVDAVDGPLDISPAPDELDLILPWILGANESADSFALADALKVYGVDVDKGDDVYRYAGVVVASAIFRSEVNGFLTLTLNLAAKTETAGITFPSISGTLTSKRPYLHHESTFTIGGTVRTARSIEIVIDNVIQADFYENSSTRVDIESGDRIVTVSLDMPFDADHDDLYETAIAGLSTNTVVYTDGTDTLTFNFNNLKAATNPLVIPPRPGEVRLGKLFQSYRTGSTAELTVTSTNN